MTTSYPTSSGQARLTSSDDYDTTDHILQNGTALFTLIQDVAKYAPVPYLQDAAASVLVIFQIIATTKNNKEDLIRLRDDAVALIAAIWRSYELSENKNEWPSRNLRDIILELVAVLDSVVKFVHTRLKKKWVARAVYNVLDSRKIIEYRQRLASAIQNFQVSSDLNVNEMLREVLRKQDALLSATLPVDPGPSNAVHAQPAYNQFAQYEMPTANLSGTSALPSAPYLVDGDYNHNAQHIGTPLYGPSFDHPRFSNIANSGISIGGGSVHVVNRR